ncbi:MAG TPA: LPS-assembly protein LptD [Pseudomonadales bacterium]
MTRRPRTPAPIHATAPRRIRVRPAHATFASLPLLLLPVLAQAQARDAAEIDWVPLDALTPEQRATMDESCCGRYVEPPLPALTGAPDEVVLDAEDFGANADGIVTLDGNVAVRQGDAVIGADHAVYDNNNRTVELQDNILIRQPGMLMTGTTATVDQNAGISEISNASYLLHDTAARGTASVIIYRDANGVVTIDNGVFTRCEPGDDAWAITGDTIELDRPSGRGTATNVTLRIKDVPVLYTPYISFPIDDRRMTGFLAPVLGSTRDGGFDMATPYYLNLAPNYDATLTPRLQTERGVMLGAQLRHRGVSTGQVLDMQYLPDDDLYDPLLAAIAASDSPPVPDRWLVNYDFQGVFSRGWSALVDYAAVSDRDYFQDFGGLDGTGFGNGLSSTTQSYLHRSARVDYRDAVWNFTASTEDFQIIDPAVPRLSAPYRTLPRLNLDGNWFADSGLEYGFDSEYVIFDRNINRNRIGAADIARGALVTGSRLAVTPQVSLPLSTSGAFLTPTLKYKYATWNLDDQRAGTGSSPSRGVGVATLDSGLIFERALTLRGNSYQQTLEPRLFYLYSEYENQDDIPVFDSSELTFAFSQLFRDDRFSGRDRVGDANQLTLAVTSRLYDPRGRELARASIGQIRHFEDRRVTLFNAPGQPQLRSGSAIAGEFNYRLSDNWRFGSYFEWDSHDNELQVGNYQFQYQRDVDRIINFGYRYRDDTAHLSSPGFDRTINQTDISGIWPLNARWSVIGRWNYDHENERNLETIAGVEYDNCCWTVRVIARQWIDNDALYFAGVEDDNTGVFVQFELKGLGSLLSGNVAGILNNGITGYREREYVQNQIR